MTNAKENQEEIIPDIKKVRNNRSINTKPKEMRRQKKTENKKEETGFAEQERKVRVKKENRRETSKKTVQKQEEKTINQKTKTQEKTVRSAKRQKRNPKNLKEDVRIKKSPLKIIPLGGLLEIGKNITVFEYEDEIVIVDCGLAFPTEDMLGVDLVVADTTYLERNKDKIKGLVITHGHEDHIGGIPYLLRQVNIPIYGTRFTLGLLRNKLDEHRLLKSTKMYEVNQGQTVNFGKIKVEFIRTSHSIPDACRICNIYTYWNSGSYRRL